MKLKKLEEIQWGTSKLDPGLYIPRIPNAHVRVIIGPDSTSPDADAQRHHHYSAYSLPRVMLMPCAAIVCKLVATIKNIT